MANKIPNLAGGSGTYQLEDQTKVVNVSDGVLKITNSSDALAQLMVGNPRDELA